MIFELIKDFAEALEAMPKGHCRRRILSLLDEAVRRDVHFIDRHPTTLFQCLWNSCWWCDCAEAAKHYDPAKGVWAAEGPPWQRPGPKLFTLLESWHATKSDVLPGFVWLRSLRPPQVHLGTAQRAVLSGPAHGVAFSPDSRRILSGSGDALQLWDVQTGAKLQRLCHHPRGRVCSVAFSPDNRHVVGGLDWGWVCVWDTNSGAEVLCHQLHRFKVQSIAYSPDGRFVVSGSRDGVVCVWNAETGKNRRYLSKEEIGRNWNVISVAYAADGRRIVVGKGSVHYYSNDKGSSYLGWGELFVYRDIRVWNIRLGATRRPLAKGRECITSVAFSPDGRWIASGGKAAMPGKPGAPPLATIRLWDADTGTELRCLHGHEGEVASVAFCPDGRRIVSGSHDKTVRVWDAATGAELHCLQGHEEAVQSVAVSPDGRWIASAGGEQVGRRLGRGHYPTLRLWDSEPSGALACLRGHKAPVTMVAFSQDGRWIASGSEDCTVRIWNAGSGVQIRCLQGHEQLVTSVVYSGNGRWIASGSWDQTVRVWDADSGVELRCLRGRYLGELDHVESVSLSHDGRLLLIGTTHCSVQVFDVDNGAEVFYHRAYLEAGDSIGPVAFSPDGQRIVVGGYRDQTIRIWDSTSGAELHCLSELIGSSCSVSSVAFSPDGRRIVFSLTDQTVRVWDSESGECLQVIKGNGDVASIAAGAPRFPWRALSRGPDTVIESAASGETVARLPMALQHIATHPTGQTWAGAFGNHLYLFTLEGDG
jgi:WD40 repeat protein